MVRRTASLLVVPLALLAALAAARADRTGGPSTVVYPPQRLPLSFSHVQHLRQKTDCAFCHEDAPDSTSAADRLVPREEVCTICHAIERDKPDKQVEAGKPSARCDACHPGWGGVGQPPRVVVPRPNLKFSHQLHVSRKISCKRCHGDLAARGIGLATRADLPRMALCLECHDGRRAPSRCTTCHLAAPGGTVRTSFPEGLLEPSGALRGDAHDASWARRPHARAATNDEAYCRNCHRRASCQECHDGVMKPFALHGNDYVSRHPVDARRNQPDCSACHRRQTFCVGCHTRAGVAMDPRTGDFQRQSERPGATHLFHPRDFWSSGQRHAEHHSYQAQRDIRQCASCHRETDCIECHGSVNRVNPHPAGWRRSDRCRALASRNARVCLRCHEDGAVLDCQR